MDQKDYLQSFKPITVSRPRIQEKSPELSDNEQAECRTTIGQLNWAATHSRPDIAFDVCELSVRFNTANLADVLRLNKVVSRLTTDHVKICFPKI